MTQPSQLADYTNDVGDQVDDFGEFDEDGDTRDPGSHNGVLTLISAAALAISAMAIAFRDGERDGFADDAAADLSDRYVTAHELGQTEFGSGDRTAAAAFATERVYGADGQYSYLDAWQSEISDRLNEGRADQGPSPAPDEIISDDELAARSDLYGGGLWSGYQAGRVEGAKNAGEDVVARWVKDDIDTSCEDCDGLDGEEWPVDEIPFFPGDGSTACLSNCRCQLELVSGQGERDVEEAA